MNRGVVGLLIATLGLCCCLPAEALGLSEGRVYEMVSPPYKGGYGANSIKRIALNGESIVFGSLGVFGGEPAGQPENAYLANRTSVGWSTVPVNVSAVSSPDSEIEDYTTNLESVLARVKLGPSDGAAGYDSDEFGFLSHNTNTLDTANNWGIEGEILEPLKEEPSGNVAYDGASNNFSHIIFTGEPFVVAAKNAGPQLYNFSTDGGESSPLRLVGVNNEGAGSIIDPACPVTFGSQTGIRSKLNALSSNGEEVFFTSNVEPAQGIKCENNTLNPEQLFVRLGDSKTIEISKPLLPECDEVPCRPGAETRADAQFVGASEDGSRVFFMTKAPLVESDRDSNNDLYMATIGCADGGEDCNANTKQVTSLVQLSHDPNSAEAANVQGVVGVASDGSHLFFVARGILTNMPSVGAQGYEAHGEPVDRGATAQSGADNLYAIDTETMQISFVADLCSAPGFSGQLADFACPNHLNSAEADVSLWSRGAAEGQTNRAGGFFVFSSYGRLVSNDANSAKDVYWYDSETGVLMRVSVGQNGTDADGNGELGATISSEPNELAISEDGTRVVFTSAEPLSENAVNGLANAYEWHEEPGSPEGHVSLISTGSAGEPVEKVAITAAGRDIFFVTSQGLMSQDTDGADDVYDARIGGGFQLAPASSRQCSAGDACQGPLSVPAPLLVPGSVSQESGGNFAVSSPKKPPTKSTKTKIKRKDKEKAKRLRKLKKARRSSTRRGLRG
jgi:hypothetical protein